MSEFTAGFAPRADASVHLLQAAFAPHVGFAAADLREAAVRPRHFSPADSATNPTAGWNPLDAGAEASGFIDPIEAAHDAGFEAGLAAAMAATRDARDRDDGLLASIATGLADGRRIDRERIARQLRQTVMVLVTRLVGEAGISADLLAERVDTAAELLADSAESALLRVNPADVALIEGKLPKTIFAVGDMAVGRGSFVLESASTIVEDGPDLWLEQLATAFDRLPVPPTC